MEADQMTFTIKICPDHGPFVWIEEATPGVDITRTCCPAQVDYDGVTCAWGMDDEGEKIEVQRVA